MEGCRLARERDPRKSARWDLRSLYSTACIAGRITLTFAMSVLGVSYAADLSSSAQERVRSATFEVVQLKPPEDGISYEKPLPFELIPYAERVDKYRSIGTAFAIGNNRFVTAAHVIAVGLGSQFGPPALRDASGQVYDIDQVVKYSENQDFIEFSLKEVPKGVRPLKTAGAPDLNSTVFAVGNALGEGVVIRDGVYTSDTPEEVRGAWKWLRFTAAASPGNSGGPLVDDRGRVIGVVLRKSPSENLNYAAPIKLVMDGSEKAAIIEQRTNFKLFFMDASEVIESHDEIPLPKTLADFYAAYIPLLNAVFEHADAQLLAHNQDRLFPKSASSEELLTQTPRSPFPRRITERSDHIWVASAPKNDRAQLDDNGFIQLGGGMFRLRAPDNVPLATLYGDSKLFMDLLLRSGFGPRRNVGGDQIKVTSLGGAVEDSAYWDSYGRLWQVRIWPVAFADAYLIAFSMPTPEGYVSLFAMSPSGLKTLTVQQQKLVANYVWLTFEAPLTRWQEYLALKADQPRDFANFSLDIDPDFSRVHFKSKRYEVSVGPEQEPLTRDSVLSLAFSFFRDGNDVVWDVGGLAFGESTQRNNWLIVQRVPKPDSSLPEGLQSNWAKMSTGAFPFNGIAVDNNGGMAASMVATTSMTSGGQALGADQIHVRYVLRVQAEGSPGQDSMHGKLTSFDKSFAAYEH